MLTRTRHQAEAMLAASKLKTAVPDKIMGPTEWLASYEKITNARKNK